MNIKQLKNGIIIASIIAGLASITPIVIYFCFFSTNRLSNDPVNWGVFGDYFAGTTGTILSFLAVLLALVSIFITATIAETIQKNEFTFWTNRAAEDLNLFQKQNKPYIYVDLSRADNKISIKVQNNGLGPLIITDWKIVYDGKEEYTNFSNLLSSKEIYVDENTSITHNSAPQHILSPSAEKSLLEVKPSHENTSKYLLTLTGVQMLLKQSVLIIDYEDIFGKGYQHSIGLSFLG